MTRRNPTRQRGAALIALLAVVAMGSAWYLVSRLNTESGMAGAAFKARNAQVLNKAKQALIGYVAAQAIKAGENNPGALPCPENPGDFDSTTGRQGLVGTSCGTTTIGRFPWRTLGLDQLVDASGESLWYVVSPGWGVPSGSNTNINSNSIGQLTIDGVANSAAALIIAPGPAFAVPAAAGCTAWSQVRSPTGTPDWRNYLECENATSPADSVFITAGPSGSFNDQVVRITVGDLLPGIEAAIASRTEREILPALKTVYTPAAWGFTGGPPATSNPVLPFAAAFSNPGPGAGTSNYQGAAGTYQGLLPFNQTQGCTVTAANPRCTTTMLAFSKAGADTQTGGGGYIRTQSSCSWQATEYVCIGEYFNPSISVALTINVTNVAMGLRTFDPSKVSFVAHDNCACGGIGTQTVPFTSAVALKADGSATVTVAGGPVPDITASGWGTYANYEVRIDRAAFGDHSLLDTANATTGWFVRNEWFRQAYYAVARSNTSALLPAERSCTTAADCLTVTTGTVSSSRSALLILAGRSINGNARPSSILADYLEFGNRTANYEKLTVTGAITNVSADTGAANAYVIATPVAVGRPFQFKAVNDNTGASTLTAGIVGPANLVNSDSSNLTASQIQANAVIEATYDGTKFTLSKRPFNDRVIVIDSN